MASFVDVCRFTAVSSGTGDFVVSAAVTGYQTPALAGAVNAAIYEYRAESADLSQWEVGTGTYTSGSTTLSRTTVLYNSSGSGTASGQSGAGTKINFSAAPQVAIVALAADMPATGSTDNAALRANGTGGSGVQASPLEIADTTGALSRSGGGGIPVEGTNTNDNAAAGYVGQIVESTVLVGAAVATTSANAVNITSISLAAGDWDVWGSSVSSTSSTITGWLSWISTTSATLPTLPNGGAYSAWNGSTTSNIALPTGQRRLSLSGTTTVYLSLFPVWSGGSTSAYGYIGARRVR